MNLCQDGHNEVCFEIRNCPACAILEELAEARKKIAELEDEIASM